MILVYTFRTFPWINQLKEDFPEVFVFGKLNEDFEKFCEEVKNKKPEYILGIAKSRKSKLESKAVNCFNNKKIIKNGVEQYELFAPEIVESLFPINSTPKTTFCNWTMYKSSDFLAKNFSNTKLLFIHLIKRDLDKLKIFKNPPGR